MNLKNHKQKSRDNIWANNYKIWQISQQRLLCMIIKLLEFFLFENLCYIITILDMMIYL